MLKHETPDPVITVQIVAQGLILEPTNTAPAPQPFAWWNLVWTLASTEQQLLLLWAPTTVSKVNKCYTLEVLMLRRWIARQVLDDEIVASVSTEKQRTALAAHLDKMEDWLYEDGEHAPALDSRCEGLLQGLVRVYSRSTPA